MKMSVSLDGFVADLNDQKDWLFKTGDEESSAWSVEKVRGAGLIIMGRKSFESMATYWPTATGPFAKPMNEIPKGVFTKKGLKSVDNSSAAGTWTRPLVFDGDLAEEISALKADSGKPIVAIGGAEFMQELIATGLVDEYHLFVHPVCLGAGLPIFTALKTPMYLKLTEVKAFPKGIVAQSYSA
jgi:dihydrofolate reductase